MAILIQNGGIPERHWPEPFWKKGVGHVLNFEDANTGEGLQFEASLVKPIGADAIARLPVVFYFCGLGCEGGLCGWNLHQVAELAVGLSQFILVSAKRPQGYWWSIIGEKEWDYVDGDFSPGLVDLVILWIRKLIGCDGINRDRVSAFGFSAGAYMLTEIIVKKSSLFRAILLGGVHGHGQPDMDNIEGKRRDPSAIKGKWRSYIERFRSHEGIDGGILLIHNRHDVQSKYSLAQTIKEALDVGQSFKAHECSKMTTLDIPRSKKNKSGHNYFDECVMLSSTFAYLLREFPPRVVTEGFERLTNKLDSRSSSSGSRETRQLLQPSSAEQETFNAPTRFSSGAAASYSEVVGSDMMSKIKAKRPVSPVPLTRKRGRCEETSQFSPCSHTHSTMSMPASSPDPLMSSQRLLQCANPSCWFYVHPSVEFGGYCCRKCHWVEVNQSKTKNKHGQQCKRVEAAEGAQRASPLAPSNPMA